MIIEVCGLPATGKSSFVKKLFEELAHAGVPVELRGSPTFYPNFNSRLHLLKGCILFIVNLARAPIIAFMLLREIFKTERFFSKRLLIKSYICVQYHINWIEYKKRLIREREEGGVILIDGSPWNIINDLPNDEIDKIMAEIQSCYSETAPHFLIISEANIKRCLSLMLMRTDQPIEPTLYGDQNLLKRIDSQFRMLPSAIAEATKENPKAVTLDLFEETPILYCLDVVRDYLLKNSKEKF